MNVTLVFSTKGQRYLRIGLAVPLIGSISCLRAMVAEEGKTTPDQVRAAHTHTHKKGYDPKPILSTTHTWLFCLPCHQLLV